MPKLKLSTRILLYLLLVSLVPLSVASFLLTTSAHSQLLNAASSKQQAVAEYLSNNVSSYLANNTKTLTYVSELYSTGKLSSNDVDYNMAALFSQGSDLQRLAIVDSNGQEQQVFTNQGKSTTLNNDTGTDAFKAANFLAGKAYISPVSYTNKNDPEVTIAVPILKSDFSQNLNNLPAANFGTYHSSGDITGAVIATYDIKDLWKTVLSTTIGRGGYAYVVDSLGNLVAHPDSAFLTSHQNLNNVPAVKQSIAGNYKTVQTTSETGHAVISTPQVVPNSGWVIIAEEPVSSIYAGVNSFIKLATIVGLTAVAAAVLVSLYFSRQITEPIKKLAQGARAMGSGKFDRKIDIHSQDELQELADTFNAMGESLNKLVTELETNNEHLVAEKGKLDSIISSATDGIVALDVQQRILSINPPAAKLVQQPPEELVGKPLQEVFSWAQDDRELAVELDKPGMHQYTDVTLKHDDQIAYLDLVASVIGGRNNEVASIITIHDLTKSRELDFMKLDFIAIAAHELRTPLTVIRGYLDFLDSEATPQLSIFNIENLQKAIQGSNDLRNLINKLLNIARIERGEMEIFIEKLDLARLTSENVAQHQMAAAQNGLSLTFESKTDKHVYVPADPSSITEVMNNLVGNAIKYNKPGSKIVVNLSVEGDEAKVVVSDDGPGIPAPLRDKLFTKFYRAERSMISGTRGTGLGLFISKTIIELQHGKIGLLPPSPSGKGSAFFFTLPIYKPEIHDKLMSNKQSGGIRGWFKKSPNRRG